MITAAMCTCACRSTKSWPPPKPPTRSTACWKKSSIALASCHAQAQTLIDIHRLRVLGQPYGVVKVDAAPGVINITFKPNPPVDPMQIISLIQKNKHIKLAGNDKLRIERALPDPKTAPRWCATCCAAWASRWPLPPPTHDPHRRSSLDAERAGLRAGRGPVGCARGGCCAAVRCSRPCWPRWWCCPWVRALPQLTPCRCSAVFGRLDRAL